MRLRPAIPLAAALPTGGAEAFVHPKSVAPRRAATGLRYSQNNYAENNYAENNYAENGGWDDAYRRGYEQGLAEGRGGDGGNYYEEGYGDWRSSRGWRGQYGQPQQQQQQRGYDDPYRDDYSARGSEYYGETGGDGYTSNGGEGGGYYGGVEGGRRPRGRYGDGQEYRPDEGGYGPGPSGARGGLRRREQPQGEPLPSRTTGRRTGSMMGDSFLSPFGGPFGGPFGSSFMSPFFNDPFFSDFAPMMGRMDRMFGDMFDSFGTMDGIMTGTSFGTEGAPSAEAILAEARDVLAADGAVRDALGGRVEMGPPFSRSSAAAMVNGRSRMQMRLGVPLNGGEGRAMITADGGGLLRLEVEVRGRVIDVPVGRGGWGASGNGNGGEGVIDAEVVDNEY